MEFPISTWNIIKSYIFLKDDELKKRTSKRIAFIISNYAYTSEGWEHNILSYSFVRYFIKEELFDYKLLKKDFCDKIKKMLQHVTNIISEKSFIFRNEFNIEIKTCLFVGTSSILTGSFNFVVTDKKTNDETCRINKKIRYYKI